MVTWTWNPLERTGPNFSLWHFSHFGNKQDKKVAPEETHQWKEVPLSDRICLLVGSQCSTKESGNPSTSVEERVGPREGDPESAVTELPCVRHNLSYYVNRTWLPGKKTTIPSATGWRTRMGSFSICGTPEGTICFWAPGILPETSNTVWTRVKTSNLWERQTLE